jgi:UDP-N-acetylglucosamine acyltransferase
MSNIHPTAIVAAGAVLADDVEIGPYSTVGPNVTLGPRVRLISHVVVEGHTEIGEDCVVHPFAYLGGPPQHTAYRGEPTRLVVGARNLIREYATMHVGTAQGRGVTTVGSDGLFFTQSHVAHDCVVDDHVILSHAATLGGHVTVAEYAIIGGLAAVHQYSRVGRHVNVGGLAAVTKDVIPFGSVWGNHAHLEGLNLVGLKRRGFPRETINDLRAAYRLLFADEGTLQERVEDVARVFASSPEVSEIIEFIQADSARPLCLPHVDD